MSPEPESLAVCMHCIFAFSLLLLFPHFFSHPSIQAACVVLIPLCCFCCRSLPFTFTHSPSFESSIETVSGAWSSLPERYNETSVFPGSEGEREREMGVGRGVGGRRKKEETIWAEVGEFQSAGTKERGQLGLCVRSYLCVVIYVRE